MAFDGERKALRLEDAAGRALPQRARGGPRPARIRHREDPCRRALRDRGDLARGRGSLLHAPGRDRGGGCRARRRGDRRQPAPRPARGADDPRGETRRRPGRAAGELGEAGRVARVRRQGARSGGRGQGNGQGCWEGNRTRDRFRPGPGKRRRAQRGRRPGLGRRPSLGARGGVRPHRPARRRARLEPGRGGGRGHRARGRGPRDGRHTARRPAAGRRRAAHHRPRGRRRARDDRADAGGRAPRRRADARPRGRQGAQGRPAHRRAEGGGEAHPVVRRSHRRRPGLCRQRQDHHAEARPRAAGEEGLRGPRPRAPRPRPRARSKARPGSEARPSSASSPATPASPKGA